MFDKSRVVYRDKRGTLTEIPIADLDGWWVVSNGQMLEILTKAEAFDDGLCAKSPAKE